MKHFLQVIPAPSLIVKQPSPKSLARPNTRRVILTHRAGFWLLKTALGMALFAAILLALLVLASKLRSSPRTEPVEWAGLKRPLNSQSSPSPTPLPSSR